MEEVKELWPFLTAILTFFGGLFLERRMRDANATKAEAEARRTLAEAEKLFAEADSEEARQMQDVIGAWRELYKQTQERMAGIEAAQDRARQQHEQVLSELAWYRRGVDILIRQMKRLDIVPEWTPDMPRGNGGK